MSNNCRVGLALALLVCGLALAGCGKKPGRLDAPPDAEDDRFPQVYPDPATDPKPEASPLPPKAP